MAGRSLVLEAARAFDAGADTQLGPACAKYFCSEMVGRVADRAVQVHGGAGYMRGVPSSGSTATPGCSASTREPARSSSWSSPASSSAATPSARRTICGDLMARAEGSRVE